MFGHAKCVTVVGVPFFLATVHDYCYLIYSGASFLLTMIKLSLFLLSAVVRNGYKMVRNEKDRDSTRVRETVDMKFK